MNIIQKLTETDIDNIDVRSQIEHQVQIQETKGSGWIFDKIISMKIGFYKPGEINGLRYVKTSLRSNAILNLENNDKHCFLWSILASLLPCQNDHPNRVSIYEQNFSVLKLKVLIS